MTGKAARSASAVLAATGNLWTRFLKRLPLRPFNWDQTSSELLSDSASSSSTASSRRTSVSGSDSDFSSDLDSDTSLPEFAPYSEEEDEYLDDDPTPRIASVSCFETRPHSVFGLNRDYPDLAVDVGDVFAFCSQQYTTGETEDDLQLSASLLGESFNKAVAVTPGILSVRDGAKFCDDGYEEDLRRKSASIVSQ
ncbi:hypothetical protein BKA62DRAFT_697382 [Auriculariales sp. MPI-PUGE-AT-0066]|nr:hypothetical protein BKA62DRAFT_697382 [Auriculariales sp. MPI-PUGE-AT-0066]